MGWGGMPTFWESWVWGILKEGEKVQAGTHGCWSAACCACAVEMGTAVAAACVDVDAAEPVAETPRAVHVQYPLTVLWVEPAAWGDCTR